MKLKLIIVILFSLIIILIYGSRCKEKYSDDLIFTTSGNVGIGSPPNPQLDIHGDVKIVPLTKYNKIRVTLFTGDTLIVYDPKIIVVFDTLGW